MSIRFESLLETTTVVASLIATAFFFGIIASTSTIAVPKSSTPGITQILEFPAAEILNAEPAKEFAKARLASRPG